MKRPLAPHVQAALAATAQPKAAAPRPAAAAHVQAAVAQARLAPGPQAAWTAAPPPPVRWNPTSRPAPPPGPTRPAPVQPKAAPIRPSAIQPMEDKTSEKKRKRSDDGEDKPRKRRRMIKEGAYNEDRMWKRLDEKISLSEQKDIEASEKKQQENLKKYSTHLSRTPSTTGSYEITYIRDDRRERAMSLPISKDLMLNAYGKAKSTGLAPTVFHIRAPSEEGDFSQNFVIRQGHDYVLFPLVPEETGGGFRQEGRDGPRFADLASMAEGAAEWLRVTKPGTFSDISLARARVARDINRLAGGRKPFITYPLRFLAGAHGLMSFAAVIRADKGRKAKATKYIESILKQGNTEFGVRFGGKKPTYVGTGKGEGRGPKGLRRKAKEDPGEDSEYSGDE